MDPAGAAPAKTREFVYRDEPSRQTVVIFPDAPHITYDIGEDGSVFKWWNAAEPPTIEMTGSLTDLRYRNNPAAMPPGAYTLTAHAWDPEGIASINVIVNGTELVDEWSCPVQHPLNCVGEPIPVNEWVMETADFAPGILYVEVVATDQTGEERAERFWVNIPSPPPRSIGAPVPPTFKEIKRFREENGLEVVFPVADEIALDERIFNLIGAWNNPNSPTGEVARASRERWGVPMRPEDVAEMEYRERYVEVDAPLIEDWGYSHFPNSYAGYEVDHRAGGIIRIGFTEEQDARVQQLVNEAGLLAADRIASFTYLPTSARTRLEAKEPDVMQAVDSDPALQGVVTEVGVDDSRDALVVTATDPSVAEQRLNFDLGSLDQLSFEHASRPSQLVSGRNHASGSLLAGDRIINIWSNGIISDCTAAFGAVEHADGLTRRFLLAAGHCGHVGDSTYRTDFDVPAASVPHKYLQKLGEVRRNPFWIPPYRIDTEAVRLNGDGSIAPQSIYGNQGSRPTIMAPAVARRGEKVCFSGSSSNAVRCSEVVGIKHIYFKADKRWAGLVRVKDFSVIPGDSGAPVWDPRTHAALGVLVSGQIEERPNGEVVRLKAAEFTPLLNTPTGRGRYIYGSLLTPELSGLIVRETAR